jgi:hypothetical protein
MRLELSLERLAAAVVAHSISIEGDWRLPPIKDRTASSVLQSSSLQA